MPICASRWRRLAGGRLHLGLAIAQRICERHDITTELGDSEALGGLKVGVSLPASGQD